MRLATLAPLALLAACASPGVRVAPPPAAAPVAVDKTAAPPAASAAPSGTATLEERATQLHRRAVIVDGHDDIPTLMFMSGLSLGDTSPAMHTNLSRMKAGGITGSFFSIFVEGGLAEKPTTLGGGPLRRAVDLVDITYRQLEKYPDDLVLATTAADIRKAKREGKIAVLMGIEGGHAIENSLGALRVLHRLGCRYMTLTHTNTNEWADSAGFSGPSPVRHHGLTPFGEEVVHEMQRIGMLVDVSHVSDETFFAAVRVAKAPVIASHSSARAVADHRRNLNDDMLRALAKNGGVVMVNFWSLFLSNEYATAATDWYARNGKAQTDLRAKYKSDPTALRQAILKLREGDPLPKVPLTKIVDHIDHIVKVAGIDHVGLGSDFDGVDALPEGIDGIDSLPKITLELLRRGYSDADVLKILGENFLRVFERTEAYARSTQTRLSGDGSTKQIGN